MVVTSSPPLSPIHGRSSSMMMMIKMMIKMKLKNKSDLFVRLCYWPGLEDCSSRPGSVRGIVSRGSIIVSGTRREKVLMTITPLYSTNRVLHIFFFSLEALFK